MSQCQSVPLIEEVSSSTLARDEHLQRVSEVSHNPKREVKKSRLSGLQSILTGQAPDPISDKENKLIRQIEYYFGDHNLPRDEFMLKSMDEEGWLSLSTLVTFPRLAKLTRDPVEVADALEKSSARLIEVDRHFAPPDSPIKGRLRRSPLQPLPPPTSDSHDFQDRTVRVTGFPKTNITLDDVICFFETHCNQCLAVKLLMRSKTLDDVLQKEFDGKVLVTFRSKEAARDFMTQNRHALIYGGCQLEVSQRCKWNRFETTDTFRPDAIRRTIQVSGFDRADTSLAELEMFFGNFDNVVRVEQRKTRFLKESFRFVGSASVEFLDLDSALKFMNLPEVSFQGGRLAREWQLEFFKRKKLFQREVEKCSDQNKIE